MNVVEFAIADRLRLVWCLCELVRDAFGRMIHRRRSAQRIAAIDEQAIRLDDRCELRAEATPVVDVRRMVDDEPPRRVHFAAAGASSIKATRAAIRSSESGGPSARRMRA